MSADHSTSRTIYNRINSHPTNEVLLQWIERHATDAEDAAERRDKAVRWALRFTSIPATRIAEAANMSRSTLYRYFDVTGRHSKPQLPLEGA